MPDDIELEEDVEAEPSPREEVVEVTMQNQPLDVSNDLSAEQVRRSVDRSAALSAEDVV